MTKCYMIMSEDNLLPDITETDIFTDYEKKSSDYMRCLYWLYLALSKRENYYELNSPTAFGSRICKICWNGNWDSDGNRLGRSCNRRSDYH